MSTSLSCDGNLNTFRYLEKKKGVPFTFLDVPYRDDAESADYLANQLKDFAKELENRFGRKLQEENLREAIKIENETRKALMEFFKLQSERYYPGELISHLYMMMGMHLLIGRQEFLDLIRFMIQDIRNYPKFEGKKILWIHLLPFYQETLQSYFNSSRKYQIIASDIINNGSYSHKAEMVGELAKTLKPDAVIQFCHWGCKQSSGGSILLKEKMQEMEIPMLILDGDGIDRRNSHDGQIKTRLEAFLEMLDTGEIQETSEKEEKKIC